METSNSTQHDDVVRRCLVLSPIKGLPVRLQNLSWMRHCQCSQCTMQGRQGCNEETRKRKHCNAATVNPHFTKRLIKQNNAFFACPFYDLTLSLWSSACWFSTLYAQRTVDMKDGCCYFRCRHETAFLRDHVEHIFQHQSLWSLPFTTLAHLGWLNTHFKRVIIKTDDVFIKWNIQQVMSTKFLRSRVSRNGGSRTDMLFLCKLLSGVIF